MCNECSNTFHTKQDLSNVNPTDSFSLLKSHLTNIRDGEKDVAQNKLCYVDVSLN